MLDDQSRWLFVALAFASIALVQTLRIAARGWLERLRARRRARRASRGERDAERLLASQGYRILGRQVPAELRYHLDGQPLSVSVRADLMVERRGRRFVAEVKTGEIAPELTNAPTRRQLLEYALAYEVDGVLLVCPERGAVHEVGLPSSRPPARASRAWILNTLLFVAALAAALGLYLRFG